MASTAGSSPRPASPREAEAASSPQGAPGRRRPLLPWGCVLLGALLAPLPYLDADGLLPILQSLLPLAGVVGVLVALGALLRRLPLTALLALLESLLLLWPVASAWGPRPPVPQEGPSLRVMTLNTEVGGADVGALLREVQARRPDALVLLEETPAHWRALQAAGLGEVLPYATGHTGPGASGTVVALRRKPSCEGPGGGERECSPVTPWEGGEAPAYGGEPFAQEEVLLPLVGGRPPVRLRAVHPFPPLPGGQGSWRHTLEGIQERVEGTSGPLVVTGDFNAGRVHPLFRRLQGPLLEAPRGLPWERTWPVGKAAPPFVQLDHLLARGLAVEEEGVWRVPGTDHAGVEALFRLLP